jgi:hypothetical protein
MGMQPEGWEEQSWQQQQGLQQNGHQQQGQHKGPQHHGKKRPKPGLTMKRTLQQKLVAQLNRQRQLYSRLQQEGAKLRGHESTLLRSVAQQSAMLHTLGTVLGEDVLASLRDSEHQAAGTSLAACCSLRLHAIRLRTKRRHLLQDSAVSCA